MTLNSRSPGSSSSTTSLISFSGRSTPYGHLGFITKLANHLIELAKEDGKESLRETLESNTDWVSWKEHYLEKVNETEAIVLGGRDPRLPEPVDPNSPI